jgi:glycosyltransferase involved in cell wall biosynthesis
MFQSLVTGLPRSRWQSTSVVPERDWLDRSLRTHGVEPILLDDRGSALRAISGIGRLSRENGADLVHAHLLGAGVYSCLAGKVTRRPVVTTLHGLPDLGGGRGAVLEGKLRLLTTGRNRVVFVSKSLQDQVLSDHGLRRDRAEVIHNGIEEPIPALVGTEREEMGAGEGDFLVGAIGNVRPAKDYANLIRAAAIVRAEGCPLKVAIVGQELESLMSELRSLVAELDLVDSVRFMGFRDDASRFLAAVDLFVSSSSSEGFSLSTVEALWLGRPVVATRSGGPEEIVRDGRTGILVPPRSPDAMAAGILKVFRNPERARGMVEEGRADVRTRFSRDRMIRDYESLYDRVLGSGEE